MANNIPRLLEKKGWTIHDLRKAAGLSHSATLGLMEVDKIPDNIRYGILKKIARVLDVKIDDLETEDE